MNHQQMTGYGLPENTKYDRERHAKMRLRPIGYGYFMVNRTIDTPICEACGEEVENPVRFINKRPYHKECFLKTCDK